jgi:hypothetical protein
VHVFRQDGAKVGDGHLKYIVISDVRRELDEWSVTFGEGETCLNTLTICLEISWQLRNFFFFLIVVKVTVCGLYRYGD